MEISLAYIASVSTNVKIICTEKTVIRYGKDNQMTYSNRLYKWKKRILIDVEKMYGKKYMIRKKPRKVYVVTGNTSKSSSMEKSEYVEIKIAIDRKRRIKRKHVLRYPETDSKRAKENESGRVLTYEGGCQSTRISVRTVIGVQADTCTEGERRGVKLRKCIVGGCIKALLAKCNVTKMCNVKNVESMKLKLNTVKNVAEKCRMSEPMDFTEGKGDGGAKKEKGKKTMSRVYRVSCRTAWGHVICVTCVTVGTLYCNRHSRYGE